MKTSDITVEAFLTAVIHACVIRGATSATRWDVATILAGHPEHVGSAAACDDFPNMPEKIVLSKAKNLMRRGLISGCVCGCRGDFSPIDEPRRCPACALTNFHHIRAMETMTAGDAPGLYIRRRCYHCGHSWSHRILPRQSEEAR